MPTMKTTKTGPAAADPAILASGQAAGTVLPVKPGSALPSYPVIPAYDPCWSTEIALLHATAAKLEGFKDDPALCCIRELIDDCLREGYISARNMAAVTRSLETVTLGKKNQPCVALIVQLLSLPDSEDLRRILMMRNSLENAQPAFAAFKENSQHCANRLFLSFFGENLTARSAAVSSGIDTAVKWASDLYTLQVSCDCAVEMRKCMDSLRDAFRQLERGCCVLLCEFNQARRFEDACSAVLENRLFEGVRHISSARRMLDKISGAPRSLGPEVDALRGMVGRLLEKPNLKTQVQTELVRLQSDLALFNSYENGQTRRALAHRMAETADGLACNREIDREIARIMGALFALECGASQDAGQRREERAGFQLQVPPEVKKLVATDPTNKQTFEVIPTNGSAYVPWAEGQSLTFSAHEDDGKLYGDIVTLVATR